MQETINTKAICHRCGKECIPTVFTPGYGIDGSGHKICYDCCAEMDKEELRNMKPGDRTAHYLTYDTAKMRGAYGCWGEVSNWPGTMKMKVWVKKGNHNIAGHRYDVWFDFGGNSFHGVSYGEDTQVCHIKCIKG